jgi:hypothetical protein
MSQDCTDKINSWEAEISCFNKDCRPIASLLTPPIKPTVSSIISPIGISWLQERGSLLVFSSAFALCKKRLAVKEKTEIVAKIKNIFVALFIFYLEKL